MATNVHSDDRGNLGVFEFKDIPFLPARFFWIFGATLSQGRAGHAHKECSQFIFSQQGIIEFSVQTPDGNVTIGQLEPGEAFYLPPLHWLDLLEFSAGSVLGVFASHAYDRGEYIESKDEYLSLLKS